MLNYKPQISWHTPSAHDRIRLARLRARFDAAFPSSGLSRGWSALFDLWAPMVAGDVALVDVTAGEAWAHLQSIVELTEASLSSSLAAAGRCAA